MCVCFILPNQNSASLQVNVLSFVKAFAVVWPDTDHYTVSEIAGSVKVLGEKAWAVNVSPSFD